MTWVLVALAGGLGFAAAQPSLEACTASAVESIADSAGFAEAGEQVEAWCVELPAVDAAWAPAPAPRPEGPQS